MAHSCEALPRRAAAPSPLARRPLRRVAHRRGSAGRAAPGRDAPAPGQGSAADRGKKNGGRYVFLDK